MFFWVKVLWLIGLKNKSFVSVVHWCGDDYIFGAVFHMFSRVRPFGILAGSVNNNVRSQALPRQAADWCPG